MIYCFPDCPVSIAGYFGNDYRNYCYHFRLVQMRNFNENTNNLKSLWKAMGRVSGKYVESDAFSYCVVPDSDWPNRVWLTEEVSDLSIKAVSKIMRDSNIPMTLSHWSDFKNNSSDLYECYGFTKKSEQIGMSLILKQKFSHPNRIRLERVINKEQVSIWESLYPQSFGYKIPLDRLLKNRENFLFFIIYSDIRAIGTVSTLSTENNIGIHGLGIIPDYRKRGFAEEVMAYLLNKAIEDGKKLALLQSSEMGVNIYLKLGFSKDFLMENYILNTKKE